jgi:hypothetical protein
MGIIPYSQLFQADVQEQWSPTSTCGKMLSGSPECRAGIAIFS